MMQRRAWLRAACGLCASMPAWAHASSELGPAPLAEWSRPERFPRPDLSSDEGGLWALMDREETKVRRSPFLMKDPELLAYLRSVANRLAGSHAPDLRVYPVRTPFFNASMAPNGMLQIWSGLLLRVDNEAQLAAVLGHEIGHYLQRHTLQRVRDLKDKAAASAFIGLFGLAGALGQLALAASVQSFSRDHEREADIIGLQLMHEAGYDLREAWKIWDYVGLEMAAGQGGASSERSLFASHPPSAERSEKLRQLAAACGGGLVGQEAFEQRLAPHRFSLMEDELKRGQYGMSLVLLDKLLNRHPRSADLYFFRAEARRLRAAEQDRELALQDLQMAIQLGSEPAQVHRSLGYLLQQQDSNRAGTAFATYLQRAPDAPDAALIKTYIQEGGN
ncbi:M48 family metalloprotease [Mitsuaria sp. WAJ17]|uniref:M48 family metallopeptidase n=1 Tax=Mitsuaria sp. WAJ17 TaxID=2761452 RepID=UPI001602EAEB|nr:M48 family metallopeptidase [Mitsuaria sp. WAJ17]MBB2485492.1 M48 family metalloprotease [Mitsuaria sp. WAJ17]